MILWNERIGEFILKDGRPVRGIGLGSKGPLQSRFIVPIKAYKDEPIDPRKWGLRPTRSGKPSIVANEDDSLGVLARLTTFNRVDNCLGRIYAIATDPLDAILVVGYGVGGLPDNSIRYEEAFVRVTGRATFYLQNVGPPDTFITINGEEVITEQIAPDQAADRIGGELIRIDEPRLTRWFNYLAQSNPGA